MAATRSQLNAKTADPVIKPLDFYDVGGGGVGPFSPTHVLIDSAGNPITVGNPLAVTPDPNNEPFSGVIPMTAGQTYAAKASVGVLCTASGDMTFTLSDGSTITLPINFGWQTFPFAVTRWSAPQTNAATATVYNLKVG